MSDPHASQSRIGRAGAPDETVGCGLLVTPRHVVTCAHVVAQALGTEASATEAPAGSIPVDLPLLADPFRTSGRVIRWLPVRELQDKTPEDVAVLELADEIPPAAEPAPLLSLEPNGYMNLPVHCFGFPSGIDEGVRRPGTCRGENALGWVHLDVERGLVEGGFSGTGAWDPNQGAAVGLVVAARTADRSAALIPARTLFAAWPGLVKEAPATSDWPEKPLPLNWPMADHSKARAAFERLLTRAAPLRFLLLRGPSETGKSHITRQMLSTALHVPGLACGRFDFKGTTAMNAEVSTFVQHLGVPFPPVEQEQGLVERLGQILNALKRHAQPALLIFDTYEVAGEAQDWVERQLLPSLIRAPWLRVVIVGQQVPKCTDAIWDTDASPLVTLEFPPPEEWLLFGQDHKPDITLTFVRQAHQYCDGKASVLAALLGPTR